MHHVPAFLGKKHYIKHKKKNKKLWHKIKQRKIYLILQANFEILNDT